MVLEYKQQNYFNFMIFGIIFERLFEFLKIFHLASKSSSSSTDWCKPHTASSKALNSFFFSPSKKPTMATLFFMFFEFLKHFH